jgi:hypothetical protein
VVDGGGSSFTVMVEHVPPNPSAETERTTPVLFLRGAWHSAWAWRSTMERLSARGFDCRAITHDEEEVEDEDDEDEDHNDGAEEVGADFERRGERRRRRRRRGASAAEHGGEGGAAGTEQGREQGRVRRRRRRALGTVDDEVRAAAAVAGDGTPPILVAHGAGAFVAQKYLESFAAAALVLVAPFPPFPQRPAARLLAAVADERRRRGEWRALLRDGRGDGGGDHQDDEDNQEDDQEGDREGDREEEGEWGRDGGCCWPPELLAVEALAAAEVAAERGQLLLAQEPDPSALLADAGRLENALNLEPAGDFLDLLVVAPAAAAAASSSTALAHTTTKETEGEKAGEEDKEVVDDEVRRDPIVTEEDVAALLRWHLPDNPHHGDDGGDGEGAISENENVIRYASAGGHLTMVEVPGRSSAWEAPGGVSDSIVEWIDRVC